MPAIVHFDVPAEDPGRASKFHSELFGRRVDPMPDPNEYYMIMTEGADGKPSIGDGMGKRQKVDTGPVNYFDVDSIDANATKLVRLGGGKVLLPRTEVPGYGLMAAAWTPMAISTAFGRKGRADLRH